MAEIKQYLARLQRLQRPGAAEDPPGPSVRFFEQNDEGRAEPVGEGDFGGGPARFDMSELREALDGIKDVLDTPEERRAFQTVLREMGGDVDKEVTADELEHMMARMKAYTDSIDAEWAEATADLPPEAQDELRRSLADFESFDETTRPPPLCPQIPETPWTMHARKKVSRLNGSLARASRELRGKQGLSNSGVSAVFKAYHAARLALSRDWRKVPVDVWGLVWTVFSADESVNTHRLSHISLLARDMSEAGVTLSPAQQLLTIEAMFVDGWQAKATESWKRCAESLGGDESGVFQDFWELGVHMYCRTGETQQAERAVNRLLDRQLDPRILLPLIRTWSEQQTVDSQERAWLAYRRMRELLGKDIKLADYDQVVSCFLTTNQTEKALYAFVDMMTDGAVDLKQQRYLPSTVANKFFLGKWLKRLIGAGDLDGAFHVVEFMRTRGVDASPIYLNGLIGAWQRSRSAENVEKAERLAWEMIEARIEFVRRRKTDGDGGASWPRATLETFSLMAENYRSRELLGSAEALWEAFRQAEIRPDAFMVNQLLESHIQAGRTKEAPALYRALVAESGVTPDPYTFSALWKTLAVSRLYRVAPQDREAARRETRGLFAETVRARHVFGPGGMDGQLARKVLHSFRRLHDGAGLVVALDALRALFGFEPPELLALELLLGTSKLVWETPPQRRRLVLAKRALDRALLAAVGGDERLLESRPARADALAAHLRRKLGRPRGRPRDEHIADVALAARQMGVHDLLPPTPASDD